MLNPRSNADLRPDLVDKAAVANLDDLNGDVFLPNSTGEVYSRIVKHKVMPPDGILPRGNVDNVFNFKTPQGTDFWLEFDNPDVDAGINNMTLINWDYLSESN